MPHTLSRAQAHGYLKPGVLDMLTEIASTDTSVPVTLGRFYTLMHACWLVFIPSGESRFYLPTHQFYLSQLPVSYGAWYKGSSKKTRDCVVFHWMTEQPT